MNNNLSTKKDWVYCLIMAFSTVFQEDMLAKVHHQVPLLDPTPGDAAL